MAKVIGDILISGEYAYTSSVNYFDASLSSVSKEGDRLKFDVQIAIKLGTGTGLGGDADPRTAYVYDSNGTLIGSALIKDSDDGWYESHTYYGTVSCEATVNQSHGVLSGCYIRITYSQTKDYNVVNSCFWNGSHMYGKPAGQTFSIEYDASIYIQTNNFFISRNGKREHWYTKETPAAYGSYFKNSADGVPVPSGYHFTIFNSDGWTVTGPKNDIDGYGHFEPNLYDVTQTHYLPGGIGFQNTVDTAFYDTYFTPYTVTPPAGYSTEGATFNYFDAGLNHLGSGTIGQTSFAITGKHFVEVYYTAKTYTVTYDANGGSGLMQGSVATYHEEFTTKPNAFVRPGYEFIGWNEAPDGSGVAWTLDSTGVYESGKGPWWWDYDYGITLYAQWKPKAEMFAKDDEGHYRRGLAKVKHDGKWKEGTLIYKKVDGQWKAKN